MDGEPTVEEVFGPDPCVRCLHRIDYHIRAIDSGRRACVSCSCECYVPEPT